MCRCRWVNLNNPLYIKYHDFEWGVPLHDDTALFELLVLECFQAGLSWECVLNKRDAFRSAFCGFDVRCVSAFGSVEKAALYGSKSIIRNRAKIDAAVSNGAVFLEIADEFGSFDAYIWHFTGGRVVNEPYTERVKSPLSDEVSADLKKRGMRFTGSTVIYSFLQAAGIVNGHGEECSLYNPA